MNLVRLYPSNGKKLKVTILSTWNPEEPATTFYCEDGYMIAEEDIVEVVEVDEAEWAEGRKTYGWCTCLGC